MASGPWLLLLALCLQRQPSSCQEDAPCSFNSMCSCKMSADGGQINISDVSCLGVPFSTLPELPGVTVSHMDVVDSGLEALENDALGDNRIESLRLMSNQIHYVGDRAFSTSVSVLKSLDLSYNHLSEVPVESLQHLKSLYWLSLHSNQIASLQSPSGSSWCLLKDTLTNLYLGENDLTELSNSNQPVEGIEANSRRDNDFCQSLLNCHLITLLNLDSNKLSSLDPGVLPTSLETLSASQNFITRFPVKSLDELQCLSWLNLRGNCIKTLSIYSFKHPKALEKLDLGDNSMTFLPSNVFNNTVKVRDLSLDLNYLEFVPAQAFSGMECVRLNLAKNRLRFLRDGSFEGLEQTLEYINLEDNDLQEIPPALGHLKRLKYLYIPSNNISDIHYDTFDSFCVTLRALSLSSNYITSIPQKALEKCTKLSHINLAYNQIYDIETKDFSGFGTSLETLLLCSNRISALGPQVFHETPVLRELSLSFNFLSELDPESLSDLSNTLESLEISFGLYIEEFPENFLRPLKSLVWLALDNNKFRTISPTALHSFRKLEYLNLESNRLMQLSPSVFSNDTFFHLRDVRISYNVLSDIESGTYSSLPSLQTLVLTGNRIRVIKSKAFFNLSSLSTIILSDNHLTSIEEKALCDLPSLARLDLQNNKLKYFSLRSFVRVSSEYMSVNINISRNVISSLHSSRNSSTLNVKTFDVSHNRLYVVPDEFFSEFRKTLRQIHMGYNLIQQLEGESFSSLRSLESLKLEHNNIVGVHKRTFHSLTSLQVLELSHNHIRQLQTKQFAGLGNLRVVKLCHNHLRSLPRDAFSDTRLERLDLSGNEFVALPSAALGEVGSSLRHLGMADNGVEHLDGTMFPDTPHLQGLDLARNKLTILPDNVFAGVAGLLSLDVSGNRLRANYKELFHYVQRLRRLRMADTGLVAMPPLPLPDLLALDVADNLVREVSLASVDRLASLRSLCLRNNRLSSLPTRAWAHMPLLKSLDISGNPIKSLTRDSFSGLTRLQHLDMQRLESLQRLDNDTLSRLPLLDSVRLQVAGERHQHQHSHLHVAAVLRRAPSLRKACVHVAARELTDQLRGAFYPRLQHLELTGGDLANIGDDALPDLGDNHELLLRIQGTQLDKLPAGLISRLRRVNHLTLDISSNRFTALNPSSLYANSTNWENIGTKLIAGGLVVKDNPWVCDCDLVWLGHWLRRWLRETAQVHAMALDDAHRAQASAREATCTEPVTGQVTAIVDLYPEVLSCHASALSQGGASSRRPSGGALQCLALLVLVELSTRWC